MVLNNFKPVSVLSFFSKVLERLMYSRILSFLNKHNHLRKYKVGFREKHGADIVFIALADKILSALNEGDSVLRVCSFTYVRYCRSWYSIDEIVQTCNKRLLMIGYRDIYKIESAHFFLFQNYAYQTWSPQGISFGPVMSMLIIMQVFLLYYLP